MTISVLSLGAREIVCGPFKSRVFVSYSSPAIPDLSPTDYQSQVLWGLIFPVQIPRQRVPDMELEPLTSQGGPWCLWYPSPLWVTTPTFGFQPDCVTAPPAFLNVAFSLYLWLRKSCSTSLQVILWESCSICACGLGMSMGGGELRIFLLCDLPLQSQVIHFKSQNFRLEYIKFLLDVAFLVLL